MRVLVTGGAGFIGSHLCDRLIGAGHDVLALDDLSTGRLANLGSVLEHPSFEFREGSVLSPHQLAGAFEGVTHVFHLAATVGVRLVLERPRRTVETNVAGTRLVAEAAAAHQTPLLFASSSEVYGLSRALPLREDGPLMVGADGDARWSYAKSKLAGEERVLEGLGRTARVARLFNTVGPRQRGRYGMVLPRFVGQALRGEPITVHGDGRQTRSFLHVRDTVAALIAAIDAMELEGQVFNVGSTHEVSIGDLARVVKREAGSPSPIVSCSSAAAYGRSVLEPRRRLPDTRRLVHATGLRPEATLVDIVRDTTRGRRFEPALAG